MGLVFIMCPFINTEADFHKERQHNLTSPAADHNKSGTDSWTKQTLKFKTLNIVSAFLIYCNVLVYGLV